MANALSLPGSSRAGTLGCAGSSSHHLLPDAVSTEHDRDGDHELRHPGAFQYRRLTHEGCEVEVVKARRAPASWTEFHETFTVCIIENGEPVTSRVGARQSIRTASVGMVVGPGELQVDRPTPGLADYQILRFAAGLVERAGQQAGIGPSHAFVARPEIADRAARELFLAVPRALDDARPETVVHHLIDACVADLVGRCGRALLGPGEREAVRRAREHILQHIAERITLDSLAAAVGMRKWGLVTLFRRHVGLPPLRYVLYVRIARARALLGAGHTPCQVASEVGFFDQSHLHRWFRRTYGVTPGEYQRAVLLR